MQEAGREQGTRYPVSMSEVLHPTAAGVRWTVTPFRARRDERLRGDAFSFRCRFKEATDLLTSGFAEGLLKIQTQTQTQKYSLRRQRRRRGDAFSFRCRLKGAVHL